MAFNLKTTVAGLIGPDQVRLERIQRDRVKVRTDAVSLASLEDLNRWNDNMYVVETPQYIIVDELWILECLKAFEQRYGDRCTATIQTKMTERMRQLAQSLGLQFESFQYFEEQYEDPEWEGAFYDVSRAVFRKPPQNRVRTARREPLDPAQVRGVGQYPVSFVPFAAVKKCAALEKNLDHFRYGDCAEFAIALHRLFGWPLLAFLDTVKEDGEEFTNLAHACVVHPIGQVVDCYGLRDKDYVRKCCEAGLQAFFKPEDNSARHYITEQLMSEAEVAEAASTEPMNPRLIAEATQWIRQYSERYGGPAPVGAKHPRIKESAIRDPQGKIWTGLRHHNVVHKMVQATGIRPAKGVQGFVDYQGNFYDRKQAAKIALAAGQVQAGKAVKEHIFDGVKLWSEDLY